MKFEITKEVEVTETIDVELPFYYKDDYSRTDRPIDITYGKIEETKTTRILFEQLDGDHLMRLQTLNYPKLEFSRIGSLLNDKYKSNSAEFEAAKKEAIEFLAKM